MGPSTLVSCVISLTSVRRLSMHSRDQTTSCERGGKLFHNPERFGAAKVFVEEIHLKGVMLSLCLIFRRLGVLGHEIGEGESRIVFWFSTREVWVSIHITPDGGEAKDGSLVEDSSSKNPPGKDEGIKGGRPKVHH